MPNDIHTIGQRVEARYCGGTFFGTIISTRRHTINMECFEYNIAPDGPFDTQIGTLTRDAVFVNASFTGEPISFDGFDGKVRAI
jgi:hypothetical protein